MNLNLHQCNQIGINEATHLDTVTKCYTTGREGIVGTERSAFRGRGLHGCNCGHLTKKQVDAKHRVIADKIDFILVCLFSKAYQNDIEKIFVNLEILDVRKILIGRINFLELFSNIFW